jgi:hypothetical protein
MHLQCVCPHALYTPSGLLRILLRAKKLRNLQREQKERKKKRGKKKLILCVHAQVSSAIYDAPAAGVPGGAAAAAAVAAAKAPAPAPPVQAPSDKVKAIQASRAEEGLKLLVYEALSS